MDIPSVIALEAGLTYLGLGIPPPAPSWGRILQEGFDSIREAPWIVVAGGIPLILTTLGFTFLGESLRDLLDPQAAPDRLSHGRTSRRPSCRDDAAMSWRCATSASRFRTPRGPVHGAAQCQSRRAAGQRRRAGGRERLGQIDPGARGHGADGGQCDHHRAAASISPGRTSWALKPAEHAGAARRPHVHGVPGPDDLAQPGARHRPADDSISSIASGASPWRRSARKAADMLRRVGIPDPERQLDRYPHEFSGGMRQRIAIAMGILEQPGAADRRRAHHRARRHAGGADHPAAARPAPRVQRLDPVHLPQSRPDRRALRLRRRALCRRGGGAGDGARHLPSAAASLYPGAARMRSGAHRGDPAASCRPSPAMCPTCCRSPPAASSRRAAPRSSTAAGWSIRPTMPRAPTISRAAICWRRRPVAEPPMAETGRRRQARHQRAGSALGRHQRQREPAGGRQSPCALSHGRADPGQDPAAAEPLPRCGARRLLQSAPRHDPGPGGRERLGQEHARPRHHRAGAHRRRQPALRGRGAAGPQSPRREILSPRCRDDVPGPGLEPEPAAHRARR